MNGLSGSGLKALILMGAICGSWAMAANSAEFRGRVVDDLTGEPVAARIYLRNKAGEWLFVETASKEGSAWPYREQWVPMPLSVEKHTTVSAHPFRVNLPAGEYVVEIERGKEYTALRRQIVVGDQPLEETFRLTRWINLAERGWYSGETHVHRRLVELPNVMLAEDLNIAFPVTFWTTRSDKAPELEPSTLRSQGPSPFGPREDRGYDPIQIDANHVILPRNTEYEIFSIGDKRHTLGAMFILNHRTAFTAKAPPIASIAEQAHREGALLDLDKHSWPWSMMLVPVAKVDLYELSNNSVWKARFGFNQKPELLPEWMRIEQDGPNTLTEWGWLQYGFEVYYALLDCGFRIMPTAGTASGVHPVPLGHSRVYVHTGKSFDKDAWLKGLGQGRSFVTTGPMLFATVNGQKSGETFSFPDDQPRDFELEIESVSEKNAASIEVLVNGQVVETIPANQKSTKIHRKITIRESSWIAVRSLEPQADGRKRFAHTAPWFVTIANKPIAPRREKVDYFITLMETELKRNRDILPPAALAEFEQARNLYKAIRQRAK